MGELSILELLERMEEIIENSKSIPFTSKVMVEKDELLDIIKEIRLLLPQELSQVKWAKEERKKILERAQKEAEAIISDAESKVKGLIDETEIVKMAEKRAEEIIQKAKEHAKEYRIMAQTYTIDLLEQTKKTIENIVKELNDNIDQIRQKNT
ncbi:ATPase [Caldicellulosiruptor morganii]|uniref:ATPase n=1 Tax=Caldicellulosiruptor morganii TaxID=1387555 RepID=A0ABY7BN43_9FIRM|nr:ATPase [Caldicellulosiruptor morganii]WAM32946.1 ATPase [Caldicellulosiruptor morganii]